MLRGQEWLYDQGEDFVHLRRSSLGLCLLWRGQCIVQVASHSIIHIRRIESSHRGLHRELLLRPPCGSRSLLCLLGLLGFLLGLGSQEGAVRGLTCSLHAVHSVHAVLQDDSRHLLPRPSTHAFRPVPDDLSNKDVLQVGLEWRGTGELDGAVRARVSIHVDPLGCGACSRVWLRSQTHVQHVAQEGRAAQLRQWRQWLGGR